MSSSNSRTGYRAVVMQVSSIGGKESFEVQHRLNQDLAMVWLIVCVMCTLFLFLSRLLFYLSIKCLVPYLIVPQVSCGNYHSLLLTSAGSVYAWGSNVNGQLGLQSGEMVGE